jgi:hypothetical protein
MAIFHMSIKIITRGAGKSVVATAYRFKKLIKNTTIIEINPLPK